ncbi:MAG TPA: glycosyltransferase family 9 protein [Burkholderiaceae bacterium]|nr:glycosyltransferase family 9 protein [Burkholderiaceae bacterium]
MKSILVIRWGAIGDLLMTTPLLRTVRKRWPGVHISFVCDHGLAGVVQATGLVDEVIGINKRTEYTAGTLPALRRRLRARDYDLALDLQPVFRSRFLAWLSGARRVLHVPRDPQFGPGRPALRSAAENFVAVLGPLGISSALDGLHLSYAPSSDATGRARALLASLGVGVGEYVLVNPGASAANRRWPAEHLRQTIGALRSSHPALAVLLLGGPGDQAQFEALDIQRLNDPKIHVLIGTVDLPTSAALMALSAATLSTDTGPMHIAAAVNAPLVALFGPTSPIRTGPAPRGPGIAGLARARLEPITLQDQSADLTCRPCDQRDCTRGDLACINRVAPATLVAAVTQQLRA